LVRALHFRRCAGGRVDHLSRVILAAAFVIVLALWWGPHVAHAESWSVPSGSFSQSKSTLPRNYTYQNVAGTQTWNYETPDGGHSAVTYRPAGAYSSGNYTFANDGTGAKAYADVRVPYKGGAYKPVTLANAITKASVGTAVGALMRNLGPAVMVASAAVTLIDMLQQSGFSALPSTPADDWGRYQAASAGDPTTGMAPWQYVSTNATATAQLCSGFSICSYTDYGDVGGGWRRVVCVHTRRISTGQNFCEDVAGAHAAGGDWARFETRQVYYMSPSNGNNNNCPAGQTYSATTPAGCWYNAGYRALTVNEQAALDTLSVDGCPGGCGLGPVIPNVLSLGGSLPFGPTVIMLQDSGTWGGDTSTTTNPDGSSSTKTSTYQATPNGSSLGVTKTETVTTRDPQGNVTGVTTTVGSPETNTGEPASDGTPPSDPLCKLYPNVLACLDVGTPPAPETLPTQSVNVSTITPASVAGSAVCPAPVPMDLGDYGYYELSYEPACYVAQHTAAAVIAIAWILALFIVLGPVRTE
jgi:hypothetical protein